MRILIDIGHPGHVHLFRPFAKEMIKRGHKILFTCREKEFEIELLKAAGFEYISFGKKFKSLSGKLWGMIKFDIQEFIAGTKFKPDILLSHGSIYAAHASFLLKKPHVSMEDTGNMEQVRLYLPFTDSVLVSSAFHKNLGKKQIIYDAYHELAYLQPKYFIPNRNLLKGLNIGNDTKYALVRFVSWNATHDKGEGGMSLDDKLNLISFLESSNIKVFISSEGVLPNEFEKYRLPVAPQLIHHVMYYAELFIGEGATMASECATLGTPALYINSMEAGTIDEQERYGLLYHFRNGSDILPIIKDILGNSKVKENWQKKREQMLEDKIDLTAFLTWFIEHYPNSKKIMKENPDYQHRFK